MGVLIGKSHTDHYLRCDQSNTHNGRVPFQYKRLFDMASVPLVETCRMSIADGATVGTDTPVVLVTFDCRSALMPITVAVRADDISAIRNGLLDSLMSIGVHIENGRYVHDQDHIRSSG